MKKEILTIAIALLPFKAFAGYQVQIPFEETGNFKGAWYKTDATYSDWSNSGEAISCTTWTPDTSTVASGTTFEQAGSGCTQNQTRTVTATEKNSKTGEIRTTATTTETRTITTGTSSRSAVGTKAVSSCKYTTTSPVYYVYGSTYSVSGTKYYQYQFYEEGVRIGLTTVSGSSSTELASIKYNSKTYTVGTTGNYDYDTKAGYYQICSK